MASSSTPVHPARYLALFLVMLIGAFLLVFLTGDKQPDPKLGIDLQGGTRVTLTARTPDGSPPSRDALNQAQQIISARVDGLGVSGSEVIIDGQNLVITVPGNDSSEARNLGQTARLYIRPVIHAIPRRAPRPAQEGPQPGLPQGDPRIASRRDPRHARDGPRCAIPGGLPPGAGAPPADAPPTPQPRPFPEQPAPSPSPNPSPSPSPAPGTSAPPAPGTPPAPPPNDKDVPLATRIQDEKKLRQSGEQAIQILAMQFQATRCGQDDVLAGNDDPNLPLVTCSHRRQAGLPAGQVDHQRRADRQRHLRAGSAAGPERRRRGVQERRQPRSGPTSPRPTSASRPRSSSTRKVVSAPSDPGGHSRRTHPDHRTFHRRLGA